MISEAKLNDDDAMDGQGGKEEDLPFKAEELSGVAEVVPHLVASSSPFLRQARTQADETDDGFRNVSLKGFSGKRTHLT